MTRAVILAALLLGAQEAAPRPNILLISTDDQHWRTLSCYADEGAWPWVRTPHIDRLAAEGVKFTHAYGGAWCIPSRAMLLTGLHTHAIEGLDLGKGWGQTRTDPAVFRFWPAELRKAGYRTGLVGKWHLGRDTGHGRDWDHTAVWNQDAPRGDWYNDQSVLVDGAPSRVANGYTTDLFAGFAADFVGRPGEKPWFLWLCTNAPHMPNTVHPRHRALYEGARAEVPATLFGPRPGKPRYMQDFTRWEKVEGGEPVHPDGWGKNAVKKPLSELVRDHNRLVSAIDEGVGRILKSLEETGQLARTVVIFTSDQGHAWGEHGFAGKIGPYEGCQRMPFLVRWPGVARAGGVCREPASVVDLGPTILSASGVKPPWEMHGRDLRPLLEKPETRWDRPLLTEHFFQAFGARTAGAPVAHDGVPWWIALREGRHKYIRTLVEDEIEELYDLEADPDEVKNLALDPARRDLLAGLRARFLAELRRTGAAVADRLPSPRAP